MTDHDDAPGPVPDRRSLLRTIGASVVIGTAGCMGLLDGGPSFELEGPADRTPEHLYRYRESVRGMTPWNGGVAVATTGSMPDDTIDISDLWESRAYKGAVTLHDDTGAERWQHVHDDWIWDGPRVTSRGIYATAGKPGGMAGTPEDFHLFSLGDDGAVKWTTPRRPRKYVFVGSTSQGPLLVARDHRADRYDLVSFDHSGARHWQNSIGMGFSRTRARTDHRGTTVVYGPFDGGSEDGGIVVAFDAASGTEQWRRTGLSTHVPPVIVEGTVVVGRGTFSSRQYVGIDVTTGSRVWSTDEIEVFRAVESLLATHGGSLVAIDPKRAIGIAPSSGDLRWRWTLQEGDPSTQEPGPVASWLEDGRLAVGYDSLVGVIDAETGTSRWQRTFDRNVVRVKATPPWILVSTAPELGGGEYRLTALDPETGRRRWSTKNAALRAFRVSSEYLYVVVNRHLWRVPLGE